MTNSSETNTVARNQWFQRLPEEMPRWKRLVWRALGKKRVGTDSGYRVTGYEFRGVTLIWEIKNES